MGQIILKLFGRLEPSSHVKLLSPTYFWLHTNFPHMAVCTFCKGVYASQGGVTRHLHTCPVRMHQIEREHAVDAHKRSLAEKKVLEGVRATHEKELQLALEHERKLAADREQKLRQDSVDREHRLLAELKGTRTVVNNFTNCTFNIMITQQYITNHNMAMAAFCGKLTTELRDVKWSSFAMVKEGMKQLVAKIGQDGDDSRQFLKYLCSPEIEVAVEDKVDGKAVLANLVDKVNEVDKQMVMFVKGNLLPAEQVKLDTQLREKSIWALN